ncbi:hypothetical protein K493DRAFT_352151 [Basidiobolus meristosporus CBS 931.73]|uniref:Amidohydrolase-related domain-containing protein n=1 Tax=Basidiobolus meristosporus CBS 931.73 TaxID=1314790 RepID=A0A1Y1YB43_9FUNG|nr:hypothetical protein K493DRAFT_352151 [Basidiobolus meristosporus CBS 931.73]|eukprot:ORX94834.1 hypothetical protein K493DRAFT_352151 [Basidiobolus meristosporus CBS 931.73]
MKFSFIAILAVLVAVNATPVVDPSSNEGTLEARGCCGPNDSGRPLLMKRGVGIVHCPNPNLGLRSGIAKVRELMDEDQKLGLGTDDSGIYSLSILNSIRSASFLTIARSFGFPRDRFSYLLNCGGLVNHGRSKFDHQIHLI